MLVISLSCSYQSKLNILEDKINAKDVPIFEFRNIIEESINNNDINDNNNDDNKKDIYELEVIYNRYIDCLRDHYHQLYIDDIKDKGNNNIDDLIITNKKLVIIKECKAAMASAIPQNNNDIRWNYDGTLLELINDIDQTNDEFFVSLYNIHIIF